MAYTVTYNTVNAPETPPAAVCFGGILIVDILEEISDFVE
jgi:hypothetical protein